MMRRSPLGRQAREAMGTAEHCLTPSVVLSEVASKCVRSGLEDAFIQQELKTIRESSEIMTMDYLIALVGANAVEELRQDAGPARFRYQDSPMYCRYNVLGRKAPRAHTYRRDDCRESSWLGVRILIRSR
jgi:hypothetical protein